MRAKRAVQSRIVALEVPREPRIQPLGQRARESGRDVLHDDDGEPNRLLVRGSALVIVGVSITLIGQFLSSVALLYGGSIVAGVGLGAGFSAYVRATAPLVAPERRGALIAAIYVAVYLSFSVPTVLGGAAVTVIGLAPTAYGYGAIVIVLAAISTVAVSRRVRDLGPANVPTGSSAR